MKKFRLVLLAVITFTVLAILPGKSAEAASWLKGTKTVYSNIQYNGDADNDKLFTTSVKSGKNAYMWNNTHTKHLHNLKNYPHTTWFATKGISKGKQTYYQVTNESGSAKGLVWGGYLRAYANKTAKNFKSAAAFENYLKTAPDQKLSRAILKQLPGIPVSYELSKYAAGRFDAFPTRIAGFKNVVGISNIALPESDFNGLSKFPTELNPNASNKLYWYWELSYGLAVTPRAAKVTEAMKSAGLKLSDYNGAGTKWRIGISVNDGEDNDTLILGQQTN